MAAFLTVPVGSPARPCSWRGFIWSSSSCSSWSPSRPRGHWDSSRMRFELHLGNSVAADRGASGIDPTWWEEFQTQSSSVARTLQPRTLGLAAVLMNLGDLLATQPPDSSVVMAVAAHVIVWAFPSSGDYWTVWPASSGSAASGSWRPAAVYFFRFCRLGCSGRGRLRRPVHGRPHLAIRRPLCAGHPRRHV